MVVEPVSLGTASFGSASTLDRRAVDALAYANNYLIDHRRATRAIRQAEVGAARTMIASWQTALASSPTAGRI
jgi:hypothetical protein